MFNPGQMFLMNQGVLPALTPEGTLTWAINNLGEIVIESQLWRNRKDALDKLYFSMVEKQKDLIKRGATFTQAERDQKEAEIKTMQQTLETAKINHNTKQEFAYQLSITYDALAEWWKSH